MDKAILYGKGTGMPLGIVPRLAQQSAPANYPANAPAWVDLHTTNIKQIGGESVPMDTIMPVSLIQRESTRHV